MARPSLGIRLAVYYLFPQKKRPMAANKKTLQDSKPCRVLYFGASTRNRTGTNLRSRDFKSLASTYSAMDANSFGMVGGSGEIRTHG